MDKKKVKELIEHSILHIDRVKIINIKGFEALVDTKRMLESALEELSKSDWISVEDELPPYDKKVFVCNKRHPDDIWKSFRLEMVYDDIISINLNKTLDTNGFVVHKGNIPITHWRRIEKLEE